jgi:hypothetical protein
MTRPRGAAAALALAVGIGLGPAPALAQAPEVEPNNTSGTANPIVVPGTPKGLRSAAISPAGDVDFFSVEAKAGNLLYVLTSGADLVLTLFAANATTTCTEIPPPPPPTNLPPPSPDCLLKVNTPLTSDPGDVPTDSFLFQLPADGTYFVQVAHSSAGGTGNYTIRAEIVKESMVATGAGSGGGPHVRAVEAADGFPRVDLLAYAPAFAGGVRVATCDLNGDGFPDVLTGPGPGNAPHVRAFNGVTGDQLPGPAGSFLAYAPTFLGGVFVACRDVNGDGRADIILGPGPGLAPHVRVLDGGTLASLHEFFAYDPAFAGGVSVAAGDVTGDGAADLVTGPGPGGGPHVRVLAGGTLAPIHDFLAYDPNFLGGVFVAAGDVNGDGTADLVTGPGPGGGPHVRVLAGGTLASLHEFFAYDPAFFGGVSVATGDVDGDGTADIITGAGPGGGPHVRALDGPTLASILEFFAYAPGFPGGVLVGGD